MTEARITTASSFPWAGFVGQIPAQSAEDVQRAKEWSARQARKPWPGLSPDGPMARRERHRRVQEWRQSRPVVARVRAIRDYGQGRARLWSIECDGEPGGFYVDHGTATRIADRWARDRHARGSDTEEPPHA